jgi:ABC-type polysaccharide/polyol phosphate export permease
VEHSNLIQKVVFPAEILPPFLSVSSLVNMAVGLPIVLAAVVLLDPREKLGLAFQLERLGPGLALLPVLMLLQWVFTVGLGYVLAMLNLFVRDTGHVVGVLITVWMFATPIFYPDFLVDPSLAPPGTQLPRGMTGRFAWVLDVNPMYWLIECYRDVLLDGGWPDGWALARFAGVSVVVFGLGASFFMSQRKLVPDLV